MQNNRYSKANDRNQQLRQQLLHTPMPESNWEERIYSAARAPQEHTVSQESKLRRQLGQVPMPESNWEEQIYSAAQAPQESAIALGKSAPQENPLGDRGAKTQSGAGARSGVLGAAGGLSAWLDSLVGGGLAARFFNSGYTPSLAVAALLLLSLYLQPIAAIYNTSAPANPAATSAAATAVAYSDDVITTAQDVTVETLDSYVALSQDALWDDSWLLND